MVRKSQRAENVNKIIDAINRRDYSTLKQLLASGDVINAQEEHGMTALVHTVCPLEGDPNLDMVRFLLEHGADANVPYGYNDCGYTPLHFAARDQRVKLVSILLDHGAIIDAQDTHGNTPLMESVYNRSPNLGIVKLLLDRGADPDKKNYHGSSPRDLASLARDDDVISVFDACEKERRGKRR